MYNTSLTLPKTARVSGKQLIFQNLLKNEPHKQKKDNFTFQKN